MREIATKTTRQNYPIDNPKRIDIALNFTDSQFLKLTKGHIPRQMEDKWFIFYENDWLYFYRSWTGFGLYKAQLTKEPGGYSIKEFWAERNQEKYKNKDDDTDIENISFLIARGLLGIDVRKIYADKHIQSESDSIKGWSNFGQLLFTNQGVDYSGKTTISDLIPVEAIQERDTDLLILEEIKCNKNFTDWLLGKTIGLQENYSLIGAWHSLTQVGLGESDIAFIVRIEEKILLFFIENKVDADFQTDQANRYRLRGNQKKANRECDDFYTILFAPKRYFKRNNDFDFYLEYEEVREWFSKQTDLGLRANYKADILEIAIEKLRRGYTPIIDDMVTAFRWAYFEHAEKYFPNLKMKRPKPGMPKRTGFIKFKPIDIRLQKRDFIIHKKRGVVDIQFSRQANRLDELINKYQATLTEEMEIVRAGKKSVSIRIKVPRIDIERNFEDQIENIEIALKKVVALYEWGKRNL